MCPPIPLFSMPSRSTPPPQSRVGALARPAAASRLAGSAIGSVARWRHAALAMAAWGALATPVLAAGNSGTAVDARQLPVGTPFVTSTHPAPGWLYACPTPAHGGGAHARGPWFSADGSSWDATRKTAVQGSVLWESEFSTTPSATVLEILGNGLPNTPVGTFPISPGDPAFAYDRNPNSVRSMRIAWGLPGTPQEAAQASCLPLGAIGVLLNGARLFHAADALGRDAVAWEVQDRCQGHPEPRGVYHHHSVSACVADPAAPGEHSARVGYIADGFGLYGPRGEGGQVLGNADLDLCHGHRHAISVQGAQTVQTVQYHYHQTAEFPYTVGCFKGTPVRVR